MTAATAAVIRALYSESAGRGDLTRVYGWRAVKAALAAPGRKKRPARGTARAAR